MMIIQFMRFSEYNYNNDHIDFPIDDLIVQNDDNDRYYLNSLIEYNEQNNKYKAVIYNQLQNNYLGIQNDIFIKY